MAKYWVFQNNQVNGPHDADDLSQLPGFSAESLVCPEGRKGTNMGDWQRASMVPQLSIALLKASQLAVAMKGSASGSMFGNLPPEPTLKDLAALGSLQEKVSLLDATVGQLQESLQLKENELLSVHRELEEKNRYAQELAVKLGGVEERLSSVSALREGLDAAVAAEHDVEQAVQRQAQNVDELTRQLTALREEIAELRARPAPAPAPAAAASAAPRSFAPPIPMAFEPALPSLSEPQAAPPPYAAPAEPAAAAPSFGLPESPLSPFSPGLSAPPPLEPESAGLPPAPEPFTVPDPSPMPAAAASAAVPAPKKTGGRRQVMVVVAVAAFMGAFGPLRRYLARPQAPAPASAPEQAAAPVPTPAQEPAPPTPEQQAEALKQQAVDLVRAWPAGTTTLSALLETPSVQAGGGLSPWQAEKVRDGIFQVNLYSPKSSGGSGRTYEFEADLAVRRVTARNEAAVAALLGDSKPKPLAAKRKPRIKAKPAEDGRLLEALLSADSGAKSVKASPDIDVEDAPAIVQPSREPQAKEAKRRPSESLDELLAGSREPRKNKRKPDESLDELLLPGIPRRGQDLDEPQAAAADTLAGEDAEQPQPQARRPTAGRKPVRQAADAALLDDLLKP